MKRTNNIRRSAWRAWLSPAVLAWLAACGGGGGGGTDTPTLSPNTFSLGGVVTGLSAGTLVLREAAGEDLPVSGNGAFQFPTRRRAGTPYAVAVLQQPAAQNCTISNGSGTVSADVGSIAISCAGSGTVPPGLSSPAGLSVSYSVKSYVFSWGPVAAATHYQLFEDPDGPGPQPAAQIGVTAQFAGNLSSPTFTLSHDVLLPEKLNARYTVKACNASECSKPTVELRPDVNQAIGYFKASNTGARDEFGAAVAISADGSTLAVGAPREASKSAGVNGNQADDSTPSSGAVYVFSKKDGIWTQQAYIKASNPDASDRFGASVALSADGGLLAVGAPGEASKSAGVDGDQTDNSAADAGAVYVFGRAVNFTVPPTFEWKQQAYIKASNSKAGDNFGQTVALSANGNVLAVGAPREDSNATGVNGDQADTSAPDSGAVYVFNQPKVGVWSQQAYIKASNTTKGDLFGLALALSGDGNTLAVGALEDSGAKGDPADKSAPEAGAVYVFAPDKAGWSQQAFLKASNAEAADLFGTSLALSMDGNTLAVGASGEDSATKGVDGNQDDNSFGDSGAAYVFTRDSVAWSQQAYLKSVSPGAGNRFGASVAISSDGDTLAVGEPFDSSSARGLDPSVPAPAIVLTQSGAARVYKRSRSSWSHAAYFKASNARPIDWFGENLALSGDGHTLAVGARREASSATGINADQSDGGAPVAGAVYLY